MSSSQGRKPCFQRSGLQARDEAALYRFLRPELTALEMLACSFLPFPSPSFPNSRPGSLCRLLLSLLPVFPLFLSGYWARLAPAHLALWFHSLEQDWP